jgi:hypothetical protein
MYTSRRKERSADDGAWHFTVRFNVSDPDNAIDPKDEASDDRQDPTEQPYAEPGVLES